MAKYVLFLTDAFTKFTFPVPAGDQPISTVVKPLVCVGSLYAVFIITSAQTKKVALQLK